MSLSDTVKLKRSAGQNFNELLMSPYGWSDGRFIVTWITTNGYMDTYFISEGGIIRPVFYLDASKTKLIGTGTYSDPFVALPR